jgi:hypothetical protein
MIDDGGTAPMATDIKLDEVDGNLNVAGEITPRC